MSTMLLPLGPELQAALAQVKERRAGHGEVGPDFGRIVELLGEIPPERIAYADAAIAYAAGLYHHPPVSPLLRWSSRLSTDLEQLDQTPELGLLFSFHRDGRVREAALRRLLVGLPSPFLFAAVAWRLNDWVEPVRAAATACAARCFPRTSPEVIARGATALLVRRNSWGRWSSERAVLDKAIDRPDAAACVADILIGQITGPVARILHAALRTPALDPHLSRVAREAVQPSARAAAMAVLIAGKVSWPTGRDWEWVDKSMGRRRRVFVYDERMLTATPDLGALIASGLADHSTAVRREALEGVIAHLEGDPEARVYATRFLTDRSPSVRERAEFILRRAVN